MQLRPSVLSVPSTDLTEHDVEDLFDDLVIGAVICRRKKVRDVWRGSEDFSVKRTDRVAGGVERVHLVFFLKEKPVR